jgi:hypothetical protein
MFESKTVVALSVFIFVGALLLLWSPWSGCSEKVAVTELILSETEINLDVFGTSSQISQESAIILSVTIVPEEAANTELVWSSSTPIVASVDQNGYVKALTPGTTTITVSTKDGKVSAQCRVRVSLTVAAPPTTPPDLEEY